ncbi:MAG: L-seryl-tRNA(Sec) selenium transferase, partial [Deltaproteobacteria bacterium]|nr:L-seryl-tRNA(Sec) selenium transferase [Deltaproteobacteria bacterium]
ELVEIGGAFRIPEVVVQGGAILREVGATNRTHLRDYEAALNENTALLLKVHTSNYRLLGFTGQPTTQELAGLGRQHDIPVVEDLGSGNLIDLKAYGLPGEPTLAEVMKSGVDLATFSGDKLLGGPQAGIVVGRRKLIEKLKKHPLNRALRIDKMTLAGLEAVLKCYLDPATLREKIPTLRMLTNTPVQLRKKARQLKRVVRKICGNDARLRLEVRASTSRAGGGALPMVDLPGFSLFCQLSGKNPLALEQCLRARTLPVVTRIVDDWLVFDPRTMDEIEFPEVGRALQEILLLSGETVV